MSQPETVKPLATAPTEVIYRLEGELPWETFVGVRDYRVSLEGFDRLIYSFHANLKPLQERCFAEVIISQHYSAATDVRFLPKAQLRCEKDDQGGMLVRLYGLPGLIPSLPPPLAGWEGRHSTHLTYTANRRNLPLLLETLMYRDKTNDLGASIVAIPVETPTNSVPEDGEDHWSELEDHHLRPPARVPSRAMLKSVRRRPRM